MSMNKRGINAVIGSGIAIFWPGAFIFGFPGVMGPLWVQQFQVGRGAIGSALFFVLASVGIFMFFVGKWQERLGTRRMITIGAIVTGLDILLAAYVSNLFTLYLWAFIMGIASCFIYLPALTSVQKWFPLRRGLVSGIVNMMFGLSGAIMAPVFTFMLGSMGYFSMNITLGIMALLVGVAASQFTEAPENVMTESESGRGEQPRPTGPEEWSLTVGQALRSRSFWFLWLTWAIQGAAGIAMVMLSTAFGLHKGFSLESAVVILTAFNLTNGTSRLVSGILSDWIGRNRVMSATFLFAAAAYFVLPHVSSLIVAAVTAGVIGFAFGTLFAVSAPLAVDCFGLKHFGAIFGLVFTAYGFVAAPLGPSLTGYLLDITNENFFVVFTYLGICCAVSAVLIRFVTPERASQ